MWATTKYESWAWRSNGTAATMTPVIPPMTKMTRKPTTKKSGVFHSARPAQMVASQPTNCTPAGIAISMLAAAKKLRTSGGSPTANMWWAHNPKDRNPMATSAPTSHV